MKNIFWCLQQLELIGGTETVSIEIMNQLVEKFDYDITVISTFKSQNIIYNINPKIKIISLNVDNKLERFSDNLKLYLKNFQLINASKLIYHLFDEFLFKIKKKRKYIKSLLNKDSLLICSSIENYYLAPKDANTYFHFHFDSDNFFSLITRLCFIFSHKPKKFIFLSKEILNQIISKKPKLKSKSISIINPCRFPRVKNFEFHNNNLLFIGRYTEQKNPILALKIAEKLKDDNFPFHLNMYGEGELETQMRQFVKTKQLENFVSIFKPTYDIPNLFLNSDLLLITSNFEGVPLIRNEAEAYSIPSISTNWGASITLIKDGINGFVIPLKEAESFANKIEEVLTDKTKLENLKRSTYEESYKLSMDNIIKKWHNLLENDN